MSSSENCLNGPKINTCCQLVTLKSAGPLNQQTFTASCVFPVPWAEEQLFVFPIFFPSFYLLPCCAVVKALVLHLYKIFHCPSVADLLDSDGWAAVADRLECPICCRQEGILKARQKCGLFISLLLICSRSKDKYIYYIYIRSCFGVWEIKQMDYLSLNPYPLYDSVPSWQTLYMILASWWSTGC